MHDNLLKADGFFQSHHKEVRSSLDDVTLKNFTNLKDEDELKVNFVAKIDKIKDFNDGLKCLKDDITLPGSVPGRKDERRAKNLKNDGNLAVQKGDWEKATRFYNLSLIFMPAENKNDIAIIIANRSATLYHLKSYEAALNDIALALSYNYPRELNYKVLDRRARCYLALKSNKDAIQAFRETISSLDNANLPKEKKHKMQTDAQLMIEILENSIAAANKNKLLNGNSQPTSKINSITPQVSGKAHKMFPAVSEAIEFDKNDTEGRFAFAARNISVGEIIAVEKAYCNVLLAEFSQTHCQFCFERCLTPLPCPTCSNVVFCGEQCRKKSLNSFHKYECSILNLIWDSGCSITCHMALRMITQNPLNYFTSLRSKIKEEISDSSKYLSDDYLRIYKLVGHEDKRSKADFFQRTHMAVFLLGLLKKTEYFTELDNEIYIGSLILRNLQVLQFNAHEIFELQCIKPLSDSQLIRKDQGKTVFLGGGIFPTLALFNHSCEPGVVRYFKGSSVIVQAIKNIKMNQQVSENYGPIFTNRTYEERKSELRSQYWFECKCLACEQKWPKFDEMDDTIIRFKCDANNNCPNIIPVPTNCQEFLVKCGLCQQFTNILKGLKSLQDTENLSKTAKALMEKGDYGKALVKCVEELKLYDETLAPPFKDYHICQQNIRRCLLTFGNLSIV